jgi:hypothetical protein
MASRVYVIHEKEELCHEEFIHLMKGNSQREDERISRLSWERQSNLSIIFMDLK